jgi:copper chaperone NosL
MKSLRTTTRILLALAALSMICGYFLPLWEIQLWAPQYPEGLNMKIWLNRLSGDFEIINGLNHYIGMRHIKQETFPEFGYMGYVLGFLIAAGMLPALTGKRILLVAFVTILFLGAGLGLYDFWRWGYDYGHNLDPKAAISVPGMSYQPPIVGYKSLLNFVAYSGPDKGGWILIAAGAVSTALLLWEKLAARGKSRRSGGGATLVVLAAVATLLPGCKSEPVAIEYGKDECAGCKMILVDKRFGTEFITDKGKIFKFDDVTCLADFMNKKDAPVGMAVITDFNQSGQFLEAGKAVYLKHPGLRSPMGGNTGAFASADAAEAVNRSLRGGGTMLEWADVTKEMPGHCTCAH